MEVPAHVNMAHRILSSRFPGKLKTSGTARGIKFGPLPPEIHSNDLLHALRKENWTSFVRRAEIDEASIPVARLVQAGIPKKEYRAQKKRESAPTAVIPSELKKNKIIDESTPPKTRMELDFYKDGGFIELTPNK